MPVSLDVMLLSSQQNCTVKRLHAPQIIKSSRARCEVCVCVVLCILVRVSVCGKLTGAAVITPVQTPLIYHEHTGLHIKPMIS